MPKESTTPDLVELRRRFLEAVNAGDMDATMSFFAPDAVWESVGLGTSVKGLTAIRRFLEDYAAPYEELAVESEEVLYLGNGVVFGVLIQRARPIGSSGRVHFRHAVVTVWRDGLIVQITTNGDIDEARAAAERLAKERAQLMSDESTAPDLVELVRRHFAALNRLDFDAVEDFYAPHAVYRGTELGTFEGAAAIRRLFEDLASPFEQLQVEVEENLDLGNGVTFAVIVARGRPVASSGQVRQRNASWAIWTDGLIERATNYNHIDEARAAAERLAEERAQADG